MISFNSEIDFQLDDENHYSNWISRVILSESKKEGDINYIFCDDEFLLNINQQYLNHDYYTDIISISQGFNRLVYVVLNVANLFRYAFRNFWIAQRHREQTKFFIMKKLLFSVSFALLTLASFSQYREKDGNRIGITLGVSQSTLNTSNFDTKPGIGWNGGLSVRGNYYNNWSMIYGMQFFQNNFDIETVSPTLQRTDTKFSLSGAQIRLLLSYNVVKNHVSFDFGPVLQINGDLKCDNAAENNIISGTFLRARDIADVGKINGNAYVGISAGTTRVRAILHYQYGFTNVLNKLNSQEGTGGYDLKGNIGTMSAQILFNL